MEPWRWRRRAVMLPSPVGHVADRCIPFANNCCCVFPVVSSGTEIEHILFRSMSPERPLPSVRGVSLVPPVLAPSHPITPTVAPFTYLALPFTFSFLEFRNALPGEIPSCTWRFNENPAIPPVWQHERRLLSRRILAPSIDKTGKRLPLFFPSILHESSALTKDSRRDFT